MRKCSKTWSVSLPNLPEAASSLQTVKTLPTLRDTLYKKRQSTGIQEDSELVLPAHTPSGLRCFSEWPQRTHQGPQSSQHSQRAVSELSRDFKAGLSLFRACVFSPWYRAHAAQPPPAREWVFPITVPRSLSNGRVKQLWLRCSPSGAQSLLIQSNIPEPS